MICDRRGHPSFPHEWHQLEDRILLSRGPGGLDSAAVAEVNLLANPSQHGSDQGNQGGSGNSGPGYPVIPAKGPTLQGNFVATRQFVPALFPAREPALTVIPTASPTFGAGSGSAPATPLVALGNTSPAFGATLVASPATASNPSGASAENEPTTASDAVPITAVAVSSSVPAGHAAGASAATTPVTPDRDNAVLRAANSTAPATPNASAIRFAIIDATEHGLPAAPEDRQRADRSPAEGGKDGSGRSTAVPAPTPVSLADLHSSTVGGALAHCWETAGDWLDDLARTEAAEAADLARRLAPFALAAGLCVAWRIYIDSGGTNRLPEDRRRQPTTVC